MLWTEIKCRSGMVNILGQVAFESHGVNVAISADILRFGADGRTDYMERSYLQIGHGYTPVSISDNISILHVQVSIHNCGARWQLSGLCVDIAIWRVVLSNNRWAVAQDFGAVSGENAPMINTDKHFQININSRSILVIISFRYKRMHFILDSR